MSTPELVMFVSHWCPTCGDEVAATAEWVAENGLPEGVEIVMVSTLPDRDRPDYPPADFFAERGWAEPVPVSSPTLSTSPT